MWLQGDYDSSLFHFQQLLERMPRHYPALVQLVQLLRWAGRPQDAKQYLDRAQGSSGTGGTSGNGSAAGTASGSSSTASSSVGSTGDPGYHYCVGLWCKCVRPWSCWWCPQLCAWL